MKPTLDEQDITVYASDAQTIQEPYGSDYSQGVRVGRTVPAKWWNWLFKAATTRLHQAYADLTNLFTELTNLLTDAQITPSISSNTQVTQAVVAKTNEQIPTYVQEQKYKFCTNWKSVNFVDADTNLPVLTGEINRVLENGVFLAGISYPYERASYYSEDGIRWRSDNSNYTYSPCCWFDGKYFQLLCPTPSSTIETRILASSSHVFLDASSDIIFSDTNPTPSEYYMPFYVIIGENLFIMSPVGILYKYSSSTGNVVSTGITAQSLNLKANALDEETGNSVTHLSKPKKVIPIQVGNLYFIGNLMFDGTNWRNVCTSFNGVDYTSVPVVVPRALGNGKIAFINLYPKFRSIDQASKFVLYDINTDTSTLASKYTSIWAFYIDDVIICYSDFEQGNYNLEFSYDGVNFYVIPYGQAGAYGAIADVVQIKDGFLVDGRDSESSAAVMAFCRGRLSANADDYVTHASGNVGILARISKGSNICVTCSNVTGVTATGRTVHDLGAHVQENNITFVSTSGQTASVSRVLKPSKLAGLREAICLKIGTHDFVGFASPNIANGQPYVASDMFANEVVDYTLYLH